MEPRRSPRLAKLAGKTGVAATPAPKPKLRKKTKPKSAEKSNLIDAFVRAVAPRDPASVSSVEPWLIVLFCMGMVMMTRGALQVRSTLLLLLNIFVRLLYPSGYYPATASVPGFIASPVTARCIAFVAEFCLYEIWAVWAEVDFWGPSTWLWLLVGVAECVSTTGVLLQSEAILLLEDSLWFVHTSYMCWLSFPKIKPVVFFGGFAAALAFAHLPRRFALLFNGGRVKDERAKRTGLLHIDPLFSTGKVAVRTCEFEEKAWVVPMLLGQAVLCTFMYFEINSRLD